ncbi:alpha/beta hydrolase [Flavobacteriaceae bacterium 3-367]
MKSLLFCILFVFSMSCKHPSKEVGARLNQEAHASQEGIVSGFLEVPENRSVKNSKTIRLAYRVLKAKGDSPKEDPILYLQGGPGGATLIMQNFWSNNALRADRDIVLMDQRGTGESNAICSDLGARLIQILSMDLTPEEEEVKILEATEHCKKEAVAQGTDLSGYNSRENAADFEALRKKLGYHRWNILGGSYGSRLGLTIMRDFPNSVRASILFGIFAPDSEIYTHFISNFNTALMAAFEECGEDPDCNIRYPRVKARFFEALKQLEKEPISFSYNGEPFVLNVQDALLVAHQLLYQKRMIGFLPAYVEALSKRDPDGLRQALGPTTATVNFINFAMYMSVMAYEELPFNGTLEFSKDLERHPEFSTGPAFFNSDPKALENWHSFRAKAHEDQPVVSNIPTLIANGRLDPITPASNAVELSKNLKNSYYMEFKRDGHSLFNSCFFETCRAFLDSPRERPDLSCAAKSGPIPWE